MSRTKKIVVGVVVTFALLCGGFMLFVNWANSDAGQQTFKEVGTRQAIESATASVYNTQTAVASANAAGTATALMATINDRIQNAKLVFEDNLDEGSPFLAANLEDDDPYFRDNILEMIVPWNGHQIWPIGKELTDFVAEADCAASNAFCGIAYGIKTDPNSSDRQYFYASGIGNADSYFFDDLTDSFSYTKWSRSDFPASPANGFLHRIRVEKFGGIMRLYVNGKLMEERVLENPNALSGNVGFYFGKANDETGIQNVYVDSFKVWELP